MDLRTKGLTADTKAAGLNCRLMQTQTLCAVLWLWADAEEFFSSRINWSQSKILPQQTTVEFTAYTVMLLFIATFFFIKGTQMKMKKKGKTGGAGPGGDLKGKDRWMMEEKAEERVHFVPALLWLALWSSFAFSLLFSHSIVLLPLFGHFTLTTGDYLFLWVDLPLSVGI